MLQGSGSAFTFIYMRKKLPKTRVFRPALWLRVPVVAGHTDAPAALRRTARLARELGIPRLHLLPYHRAAAGKYRRFDLARPAEDFAAPDRRRLAGLARELRSPDLDVIIGG